MTTIKETMVRASGAKVWTVLRTLAYALALAMVGTPVVSWAQQVPDAAAGAHRPTMDSAANGVPVVDIVAPNAQGVSHNKYQRFDVDKRGVILNNSAGIVRTQLGGYVAGNDNLKGGEASLILNEVTSALPSTLNGYIEVGGKPAAVVIANPYGITCDGCGIINSQRFTLTTGTPVFGGSGSLDAFHVTGGGIAIGSGGLDGSVVDRTDLIARAVQLNGKLWAKQLDVVAGSNDVGYADASVRANVADASRPAVSIDVAALGGMYADKIRLVGTEAGVGVVSSGAIAAQAGDLQLSSAGEVRLGGTAVALNDATLDAAGAVTIDGSVGTQNGNVSLSARGPLTVNGGLIAGGSLAVNAATDVDVYGRLSAGHDLSVYAAGRLRNMGLLYTDRSFDLRTGSLANGGTIYGMGGGYATAAGALTTSAASTLHAGGDLSLDAGTLASLGVVDAGTRLSLSSRGDATLAGAVQGGGDVSLRAAGLLDNAAVAVSGGGFAVQAGSVVNRVGGVVSSGADLATTVAGDLANQGTLYAVGGIAVNAGTLTQAASGQIYGIGGAQVELAGALDNAGSLVGANGLSVTAQGIDSRGELGTQQGDATLFARGDMTLAGDTVVGGALALRAAGMSQKGRLTTGRLDADVSSLDNTGDIYARGDAAVRVAHDAANAGSLYADGSLSLAAEGNLENTGTVHAGSDLAVHASSLDSGKQIDAGRDLAIDAASLHLAGNVQAGRDLSLATVGTLTNEADVVAGRDATVHAGDLINAGSLSTSRDLALTTSGDVNDTGKLYAGRALTLDANALTVGDKASVSAADTVALRLRDALRSTGSVVGANGLTVDAGTIDSSGSLGSTQGSVRLTSSAGDIHLGGTVSAATAFHAQSAQDVLLDGTLTANAVDLVAARTMTLAGALHATGDAAIDAGQDLLLAGDTFADGALVARATGGIHQSGTTHAGGDLSLDAATLDGEGTLDAGNDLALHADTATLGGRLQAGRDVRVTAGTLTQAATVVAARDAILGAERFDGRKGGTVSAAHDLTLTVAQDATDAGLLFAGNVLTLGASAFSQSADGRLDGTQGLVVSVDGALDSDGAIVGGNGLSVTAGSLRSGGQLGSTAGDVSLTTTHGDLSLAGTTVSAGRLDATSAGALAQTGAMNAHGATLVSAGDIDLAGDTSVDGALALDAGRDLHNTGSVYATGTLDAHASGDLDNRGDIAAEQDLKARADGSLTQDANGKLQTNGTLTVTASRIDSAGTLAAAHDVGLTSQGDTLLSGTTQAGGALDVQSGGTLTNAGKLLASSALSVEAASIGNTGDLSTDGTLALHAAGAIDNQGTVYAGKALGIGAGGFTQGASAQLSGADTVTIDVSGAMANAGKLVAARTLDVKAGSLSSTGTLGTQQGDMHLLARQGDLTLGGTVASAADLDARATGAIRQSGQLAAHGLTLHADGDLAVQGDIAAKTATLSSGATLSQAGTVSADDISLDGVTVSHAGRTLSAGDLRVHGATVDVAGTLAAGVKADGTLDTTGDLRVLADGALTAHGSLLAGNMLDAQANALDLSYGTQRAGGNAGLLARTGNIDHTAADLGAGGSLTVQAAGALLNRGVDGRDARMQANALLLTAASIDNTRGKLLQSGSSVLVLRTAGTIDNTGGTIVNNGSDLTLHGSRVVNTGGSVQLAGNGLLDVGADQDVDNRQGTLASNGTTRVVATTALANDGGLINAHGNTTVSASSLSNTANGAISGATLGVTVANGLNNTGGLLQATGGNLGVTAANLSNGGGTIQSAAGATTLGVGGTLDNGNGTIAAGGGTTLTTARLINAGAISGAQLNVQATDTVANTGRLQSLGALDLRATNGLNNNGGRIEANGATTLASASISNIGGRIANASAALTQVTSGGGIDNRSGTLGGQGDVSLSGTAISNAQGGTLVAANNLTLGTGQLDNGGGTVYAGNTFNFVNAGASASNVNGKITAGRQLNLTLFGFDNSGGTVQAGIDGVGGVGNVMLDIRNLVGQGTIVANNTLGMHLVGDYVQAAGSSIKATGGFSLAVDGQFTNNGSIQAVNGLTISAAGITNNAGALLNSANTQLVTGGTVTNAGSIQGNTVGITAGVVNNTGSIMGGNVTLQAGTVINGADFGQSIGNPDYQSGTIAATNSVDIYTSHLVNRDAQIFSLGNINVAGAGRNGQGLFDTRAGLIDNISGSIQAQGSILLAANQINNVRRVLSTTSRTLSAEESAASQPLPITDYKHAINKVQEYETWTEYHTLDETVVNAASAQSQIVAGGNISLYGSVKNNTSTIAANGFLAVNQQGAGGGTGMVAGNENVSNESLAAGRTIQKVAVTHHMGCGTDLSLCDNAGGEQENYSYRPDTNPSDLMHDNYTALGAVMSGAAGVAIGGLNVSNGGVTPDGRSVGNTRLDPNAQAIGLSSVNKGNAQGATGLPQGAQVDPATGHAPQVLGGAGQPLAGVTLPTGGIYSVRGGQGSDGSAVDGPAAGGQIVAASAGERSTVGGVDAGTLSAGATGASARNVGLLGNAYLTALLGHAPSGNYLIETNARFADYSQFISSDYLLDKLGVDPARTMMRLGDGFYEQQLVVNQVTQLTGRAYLSDYGSGLDEYQALMNNGAHAAQAMNLSVGVALTADQVSALTQDIVWMVQQNVDGHDVLVPVVYLASGNLGLTAQGAVIAGKDVSIDASGTLSNDGTIRGQNSTLLTAKDLLNSGRISSDGLTAISATGNITNLNGRIDGAGVSLVAGGDIRSENVGGLIGSGLAPASITATQGLQINAGHDLSLDHTTVNSGGDALLTAGHDLTLAGKGVTTGGSLALAAGHDVTLASSTVTTQPSRWTTGTRAEGVTLDAGKDLSVVAGNDLNLSVSTLKAGGDAALQAGHDLTLGAQQTGTRWTTQTQGSSVTAGGSLSMQAGHDLSAQAATVKAGGDMALLAGHDLSLTASTDGTSTKVTHQVTGLEAGGNLAVAAGNNALLEGTTIKAGGTAALQAGNDLTLTTVTDSSTTTASWKEGKKHITQTTTDETVRGVVVDAGKGVQLAAGHDATLNATTVSTAGDITVAAGHDLILGTADESHEVVTDTKKKKSGLLSSKTTTTHDDVSQTIAVGTMLDGDNVKLVAGNDLTATAAQVKATGDIAVSAGHDVNLLAGDDVYDETHDRTTKRSGMTRGLMPTDYNYQTQSRANADRSEDHVATGTVLSGDSVTVRAGHNVTTEAAQIAGTHDVTLAAGNDLNIGTAVSTHAEGHKQSVSTSGFIQNGLSVTIGNQKQKGALDVTQVDATGSLIGSTDGKVTMSAGQDVHITGSDIISHTGTTIVGQNVTIDPGLGTVDTRQTQSIHSGGINVGLTGGMATAAQTAYASAHRASQVDDDRLKVLYAAQAGYGVYDAVSDKDGSPQSSDNGMSVRVGLGASTASSHSTTHDDTTGASTIRSDGNVTIAATNGNLNVIGSQIDGKNVSLGATGDLNLLSQAESHTQKSGSANASGEIGLSVGSQTGIYVTASVGKGIAHGNGTTHANTSVNASDTLSLVSGNDTNILGAQAKGETVVASIGGDLNIASQQATNDYASQYWQVGGTYVYGYGSQINIAVGKTTSNYKSVDEVSGIGAGSGGYNVFVGGNTDLKGGVIASSADAAKNAFSTGTLTFSDIQNKADYQSFSGGISVGSGAGFSGSMSVPQSKDSSSTTKAGIAAGTIDVRNQPGIDLTGLDRNPDIDAGGLKPIFDEKKVAERQELSQVAGQVGFRAAGDVGEYFGLKEGSPEKIALHGAVAAAMASMGGGNVGAAVAGSTANQLAINALAQSLQDSGYVPGTAEFASLMKLGSAAIGLAAGGTTGGVVAEAATQNNWLLHSEVEQADRERAACGADQACKDAVTARMEKLNMERDYEREQFGNNYFLDIVKQYGVLTEEDKADAAKAYYAQYGIKPGDSIVPEYGPANELSYQWRQFVDGFNDSSKAVGAKLDHYQEHPVEIPGAIAGAIYDGVTHTATNVSEYVTSDVPAWTLTQQMHDQYGVPSSYNLGVGAYNTALTTALVAPALASGGVAATPAWISEWSPIASVGGATSGVGYPAVLGSGLPAVTGWLGNSAPALYGGQVVTASGGILGLTTMTGVDPSKSGNLSATKFNTSSTSLIDLTVDEKIISQYVQFNGDKTGVTTENLINIIADRQGLNVLDGGKYGSNNGFDHVLQAPDGTVTIILDSKQIRGGSASLSTDAGVQQLSDRWIDNVMANLDPSSDAYKAISKAQKTGTLVKGVAGVDRNTGRPVLLKIN
ncbi:hemagglutinin repeat-containing protein [Luteibacter aegosomatis]|uniref:two-partner secretion domain-containing protein n=1 Tax=Luteibacter aegosomatis TaxID=2911537 RepID=UPI001FF7D39E|nr:hemagglutinin repeat-containing protein [Luteibacter aegosomatis]UPG87711.1 hemagglutinin repeat-containing protein [Luteibacter aegosomatis]